MKNIILLFLCGFLTLSCYGQLETQEKIVGELAAGLQANYIFEDKAQAMHDLLLENQEKGHYKNLQGEDLASSLQKRYSLRN